MIVNKVIGYKLSQDYALLARLAREQSVICLVRYDEMTTKDVAKTIYKRFSDTRESFDISARGIGYVGGEDEAQFIRACACAGVAFIVPEEISTPGKTTTTS